VGSNALFGLFPADQKLLDGRNLEDGRNPKQAECVSEFYTIFKIQNEENVSVSFTPFSKSKTRRMCQ